jgi:hypothetical protein
LAYPTVVPLKGLVSDARFCGLVQFSPGSKAPGRLINLTFIVVFVELVAQLYWFSFTYIVPPGEVKFTDALVPVHAGPLSSLYAK